MFQEIIANVDVFIFVLVIVLLFFALCYHVVKREIAMNLDDDQSEQDSFLYDLFRSFVYASGEFMEGEAWPSSLGVALFIAMVFATNIVMLNILIAIVSDTYSDAAKRSIPLFWRARLDLIAE